MHMKSKLWRAALAATVLGGPAATFAAWTASGSASSPGGPTITDVAAANTKSDGSAPATRLARELRQLVQAQGSTAVENPSALTSFYGYDNDALNEVGLPVMVPT